MQEAAEITITLSGRGGVPAEAWLGLWSGLIGAVVGAGVSGLISYRLQKREHDRVDRVRATELQQRQRSIAHRLIVKLIVIASDLTRLEAHLVEEFAKIGADADAEAWPKVLPLYVGTDDLNFDGEETALLLDLGLNDEFNAVASIPASHSQLHDLMRRYASKREEIHARLPPEAFPEPNVIEMTREQELYTAPLRAEMNGMIIWAYEEVGRARAEAQEALNQAYAGLKEKLDLTFQMEIVPLEEESGSSAAEPQATSATPGK